MAIQGFSSENVPSAGADSIVKESIPVETSSSKVNDIATSILIPKAEYGKKIIKRKEFEARSADKYAHSCEDIKKLISGDVEKFAEGLDYNPLHFIRDYLKHYEVEKQKFDSLTPVEAFNSYNPNSADQALVEHGTTCVGQSIDVLKLLEVNHGLKGHVVVEALHQGQPTHAAAIIPCKDGIVLIDTMYAEKLCIIPFSKVKPEEVSIRSKNDMAHFSFELVQMPSNLKSTTNIILHVRQERDGKTLQKEMILRNLASADKPVMKKHILDIDSHGVFNASPNLYIVYFKDQKIRCQIGRGSDALRAELPFSAFDPLTKSIDAKSLKPELAEIFLTDKFFDQMKTSKETALEEIFLFVEHQQVMKTLYEQVGQSAEEVSSVRQEVIEAEQPFDLQGSLSSIERKLEDNYIFPDVAKECIEYLQQQMQKGVYEAIKDPDDFAKVITDDLQRISKDKHIRINVNASHNRETRTEDDEIASLKSITYGLGTYNNLLSLGFVRELPQDLGYLEIRGFQAVDKNDPEFKNFPNAVEQTRAAYSAAMEELRTKNPKSIVIDLRNNGGGSPYAVQLLCSYFLPENTPLNTIHWRKEDQIKIDKFNVLPYDVISKEERLLDVPMVILTSQNTFSAGEEFANNMKALNRATLIGEVTKGGANPGRSHPLKDQLEIFIPDGQSINPHNGSNWEGIGVIPHIQVSSEKALERALLL